jgi:hypothetical protein
MLYFYFRQLEWMVAIILDLSVKKQNVKNIHFIEPGNHPTLTENFLLIEVAVNHVHMTKCNCLTI